MIQVIPLAQIVIAIVSDTDSYHAQGIVEHETRALVLLSNDNGLLQDAELAWDVRGSPLRSFPWQVHARRTCHCLGSTQCPIRAKTRCKVSGIAIAPGVSLVTTPYAL